MAQNDFGEKIKADGKINCCLLLKILILIQFCNQKFAITLSIIRKHRFNQRNINFPASDYINFAVLFQNPLIHLL